MSSVHNPISGLSRLSAAKSRSITAENPSGGKGRGGRATEGTGAHPARDLGQGWKISPSVEIAAGETFDLANIQGSGCIRSFWITHLTNVKSRDLILRMYWDGSEQPSVEVPMGNFFCNGWETFAQVTSLAVCVNPGRGYNCFWEMPFRSAARVTLENRSDEVATVYYQINYDETEIDEGCAYFHAQFRHSSPVAFREDHVLLEKVHGRGHYVGTYIAWETSSDGWWGEGEIKFFMDGDEEFPTICGTGTEDYFCGSHNFDIGAAEPERPAEYTTFNGPYAGLPQVIGPDVYKAGQRFGMYRWHVVDPIRFEQDLCVTIQSLGWDGDDIATRKYRPLEDDIASVAFWYQAPD